MLTEITLKDIQSDALLELLIIKMEEFKAIKVENKADTEVYRLVKEEIRIIQKVIADKSGSQIRTL